MREGLFSMNWSKFKSQFQTLQQWSEDNGHDSLLVPLKMAALILRGYDDPVMIAAAAQSDAALRDVIKPNLLQECSLDIPSEVYELLLRWIHTLPREPMVLGSIYESISSSRRVRGLYYTPPDVVGFILDRTVKKYDIVSNPKVRILDPACGCGNFLLMAYDVLQQKFTGARNLLREKYPAEDWSDAGIHRHILKYNLWGADIDPTASDLAAISLSCKGNGLDADSPHIITYDSLKRPINGYANENIQNFWSSKYNFVIGNPPYLSFGLRGANSLTAEYKDYLRQEYSASAQYKLSYYVLFMQRGIEMLSDQGKLGFIVPDSFLLGRYYSKIRQYILEHASIDSIAHITTDVFRNAAIGYLTITILTKQADRALRDNSKLSIYRLHSRQSFVKAQPCCEYNQDYFLSFQFNRFRIFFEAETKELIDRLDSMSQPLKEFASGHTGIRSMSRQQHIVSTEKQGGNWHKGLISGSQIHRYGLTYEGHWLNIDSRLLYKGGWSKEIVERRKILIRQTGFMLVACIDSQGYYHLNNIHSFVATTDTITLDYLAILLNSRLMSFYYHIVSMEYGRSMAQTDIETLELLPVVVNEHLNHTASGMVNTMENLVRAKLSGDSSAEKKFHVFDDFINQMVYRVYGLSDSEINYIEEYENNLFRGRKRS